MKLTVGKKLYAAFLVTLLLMASVGGLGIYQMKNLNEKAVEINTSWLPAVEDINHLNYLTEHARAVLLKHIFYQSREDKEPLEKELEQAMQEVKAEIASYESTLEEDDVEDRKIFNAFKSNWEKYEQIYEPLLAASRLNDTASIQAAIKETTVLFTEMDNDLNALVKINHDGANRESEEAAAIYAEGRTVTLVMMSVSLLLTFVFAAVITNGIRKRLQKLAHQVNAVAEGNLRLEALPAKETDEIAELTRDFNNMLAKLREIVFQVNMTAQQVAASSEQLTASAEQSAKAAEHIAVAIQEVASGSEKQVQGVEESFRTVEEMSGDSEQIAAKVNSVADISLQASELAQAGNQSVQTTSSQMNAIHSTMNELAHVVKGLGERSTEIGQIIEVITDIADRTNLLALNAAIEASRAGESGRGFAVVAAEVRKLAEQSQASAEQIALLIQAIQQETEKAVSTMEAGTKEVQEGMHVVQRAGQTFEQIHQSVLEVAAQIQEVSAASGHLATGAERVVHAIQLISGVAQTVAAGTQNITAAAEEQLASMEDITSSAAALSNMAEELQSSVRVFKL
ncbi:HAMP domain-containing methyl-accepting chemotaxis protein [Brevibacillus agri]|uniref:HAMP domain-containing methyl-accepting chemotaxis protein n=1 Tax=Brevibacillus agri TaxID=51101 RepID=UPI001EE57A04|nr:methyl-accepting chemotaxis protein [Brevibacillus agri]MCG5252209.1 methyl-accepting chemotaxis protein [Brevibacillus agri]